MNMEHLKYLIAIGKERTMADAAERLFVTPQALSMAIKKMENELNMKLLYRSPNGVMLSENGEWLVDLAQTFFDNIEKRKAEYAQWLTKTDVLPLGKVALAVNSMGISCNRLTEIICDIYFRYPQAEIALMECPRNEVERMVLEEEVDLGFIYRTKLNGHYIDELPKEVSFHPLQLGKIVIQASPRLSIGKAMNTTFEKIAKYRFCAYGGEQSQNNIRVLLKLLNCGDMDLSVCDSFLQYQVNILSGKYLGISLKMADDLYCASEIEGAKCIDLQDDISCSFGILRKKEKVLSPNMKFIFDEVLRSYHIDWEHLTADS